MATEILQIFHMGNELLVVSCKYEHNKMSWGFPAFKHGSYKCNILDSVSCVPPLVVGLAQVFFILVSYKMDCWPHGNLIFFHSETELSKMIYQLSFCVSQSIVISFTFNHWRHGSFVHRICRSTIKILSMFKYDNL
jgi:hypothetical protein